MTELEASFIPDFDQLERDIDGEEPFEAEVDLEGTTGGGGGGSGGIGGGLLGAGILTKILGILGALLTVLGGPIQELLSGIANIFQRAVAPVFALFRPVLEAINRVLLGFGQFLSGDLSLQDIIDGIKDAISGVLGQTSIETPFGDISLTTGRNRQRDVSRGRRTGNFIQQNQGRLESGLRAAQYAPLGPFFQTLGRVGANALADRTDESKKEELVNNLRNLNSDSPGGNLFG